MTNVKSGAGVIRVPLIFLGLGNIGGTLLRQILSTRETLAARAGLHLVPIAVADVSGVIIAEEGLTEQTLEAALQATSGGGVLRALPGVRPLPEIAIAMRHGAILSDLTASQATAPVLWDALDAGCGVVLANKVPLAGPWATSRAFLEHPFLRYEVTVGAGLPVIDALHYLRDTGDQVTLIEGCLSGTLGYLCAELERGVPYSAAVAQARAQGFTEPDPRDDLSGKDVARKSLILARTAGWALEETALTVEALYPPALATLSTAEFLAATPTVDADYTARVEAARAEGKVLRYVARVTAEGGTVGLVAIEREGPLGALRGPANYIALHTTRYDPLPMVISGPGAGREVTAAGVLGDIVKLAQKMAGRE